jgi:hypothetical protein
MEQMQEFSPTTKSDMVKNGKTGMTRPPIKLKTENRA